jgi:hypothetical protein
MDIIKQEKTNIFFSMVICLVDNCLIPTSEKGRLRNGIAAKMPFMAFFLSSE